MIAAAYGSVSDIEIVWTVIAAVGLLFSAFTLGAARGDRRALIDAGIKNGRRKVALYTVLAETTRAIKQVIFLLIGGALMFVEEMPPRGVPLSLQIVGFAIRWGLILSSALTTLQSYLAFRLRREISKE